MGEIVAAVGTCHTPYLFTNPPDEDPEQLKQAARAMRELGTVLDEAKPDVIVFLGSDHVETFSPTCIPTFCIIAGSRAIARFAGREIILPVHREMAEDLLSQLVTRNFDMAYSEDAELGHAFAIPFDLVIGKRDIPVIPFFTNVYVPPLPSPRRCAALGQALAEIIEGRKERVAIITSGGMSHFPGTSKYLHPEFDFDRWLISQLEVGNTDALLDMTNPQLDEVGNTEMLNWAIMLGAIGQRGGELIDYIPTWHHGLAMMRFLPERPRKTEPLQVAEQFGGFKFQNQSFEFYKHPPAEGYGLNKLLFESRHSAELRRRILNDLDSVAREYELAPPQRKAAEEMINVGKGGLVSEHVAPLVEAGAHPLQALMSLHVIFATAHRDRGRDAGATPTTQTTH
jgi:aromatic ring-opening dioxygenase catalytic subunit (LigB family)